MYHNAYPNIRIWYQSIQRQLQKERILTNCFGRRCRFMGPWEPDLFKAAYSFQPQSTVVDSLNQGMVKMYEDEYLCGSEYGNIDILAQVHDSILMQIPIEKTRDRLGFEQKQNAIYDMVSPELHYNGRSFKIATDSKFGFNWGAASKSNPFGMREVKDHNEILALLDSHEQQRTG
jgi:DNA polymerase I-like protein with 3'-5' exonuclease and polymerase domains